MLPDRQALQLITTPQPLDTTMYRRRAAGAGRRTRTRAGARRAGASVGVRSRRSGSRPPRVSSSMPSVAPGCSSSICSSSRGAPGAGRYAQATITTVAFERAVERARRAYPPIVSHLHALDLAPQLARRPRTRSSCSTPHLNPGQQPHEPRYGELLAEPDPRRRSRARERRGVAPPRCAAPRSMTAPVRTCASARSRSHCRAVSSVPDHTWLGWLLHLMQVPATHSPCRSAGRPAGAATERQRARQRYRRIWGVQRGREMRMQAPDPEAIEREQEAAELNSELSCERRRRHLQGRDQPRAAPPVRERDAELAASRPGARTRSTGPHRRQAAPTDVRAARRVALHLAAGPRPA